MTPIFFDNPEQFRNWLSENHTLESELLVGYYKKNSGKVCMTWEQSVEVALCFGWIDGIRRKLDEESYCNRFTPRRPNSIWSNINVKKVEELIEKGLMTASGLAAFEKRKPENTGIYSFENDIKAFTEEMEQLFKSNSKAWEFFSKQGQSYKKTLISWVMSAKREETKQSRLCHLIESSEQEIKLR